MCLGGCKVKDASDVTSSKIVCSVLCYKKLVAMFRNDFCDICLDLSVCILLHKWWYKVFYLKKFVMQINIYNTSLHLTTFTQYQKDIVFGKCNFYLYQVIINNN